MGPGRFWQLVTKPFTQQPVTLADGERQTFDCRGHVKLGVLAGAGATVTIHKVDSWKTSEAVTTGTERDVTAPAAGAAGEIDVTWPFYLVEVSGGSCVVAVV